MRVLDAIDKYVRVVHPRTPPTKDVVPFSYTCFEAAAQCLRASTKDVRVPVQTVLSQFATFQELDELGYERFFPYCWGFKVLLGYMSHWQQSVTTLLMGGNTPTCTLFWGSTLD